MSKKALISKDTAGEVLGLNEAQKFVFKKIFKGTDTDTLDSWKSKILKSKIVDNFKE